MKTPLNKLRKPLVIVVMFITFSLGILLLFAEQDTFTVKAFIGIKTTAIIALGVAYACSKALNGS